MEAALLFEIIFCFGPLFTFHMVFAFVKKYIAFALPSRRDKERKSKSGRNKGRRRLVVHIKR